MLVFDNWNWTFEWVWYNDQKNWIKIE